MRTLILILLAGLLGGCATSFSVPSDFRFKPDTTLGLVVGSITYDSGTGIYSIEGTSRGGALFYARAGNPTVLVPAFDEALKRKGGTFAVAVPPGPYTLQRWTIDQGRIYSPRQALGIGFTVAPGQVTYLGNVHFDADGEVSLEDLSARDLPILRSRFPAAGLDRPAYVLRPGTRLEHLGNEPARGSSEPMYVATAAAAAPVSMAPASAPAAFDPATMASIADSTQDENSASFGGTLFFVVTEIDGKQRGNSQLLSHAMSAGRGRNMRVMNAERPAPAGKVRLGLRAIVDHAAPIQSIFSSVVGEGSREVAGVVEVELKPDARYRVSGRIDEYRSEVWLEEADSRRVVAGSKVASAPTAEAVKAAAAPQQYTCCNFHHDDDGWISDANWLEKPFTPAGTPLRVYEVRSDRAKVQMNDRAMWLGLDYGRKQQTVQQFLARMALRDDPSARIAGYPAAVQAAIRAGKVLPGMTKEQVVVALGPPRADLTASPDLPRWTYQAESEAKFVLVWDAEARLQAVEGPPEVRALVLQAP